MSTQKNLMIFFKMKDKEKVSTPNFSVHKGVPKEKTYFTESLYNKA
jgi:hypothetical protein